MQRKIKTLYVADQGHGSLKCTFSYEQFERVQEIFGPKHATRPQKDPYQFSGFAYSISKNYKIHNYTKLIKK